MIYVFNPLTCKFNVSEIAIGYPIVGGTEGSVLFVGPGPSLSQDNAKFFWDDINNYLGIGTNTPSYPLEVNGGIYSDTHQFNTSFSDGSQEGRLQWNSDDGTLEFGLPGGNVNLQIGFENLIKAKNVSGSGTTNGKAFYISGATGAVAEADFANASEQTGAKTIAIATEDITDNQQGYFTTFGLVRDMNTSFGSDGDEVFLDATDGGLTTTKIDHPNFRIKVGYILRSHATEGVLFVKIDGDQWLKRFQSMREPTGFDANQTTLRGDLSFTNGTRTFAIDIQAGESYFNFWVSGREFKKTAQETLVITDVEGLHYIYYDADGTLTDAVNPSDASVDSLIRTSALVAVLYWDATNNEYVWFNDERHLNQMDGNTHNYLHFTRGTQWLSGGALGDFDIDDTTNDSGAQFSISSGSIADEDIVNVESDIASTAGLEIIYLSNGNWRRITESGFSVLTDTTAGVGATGRLVYNNVSVAGSETLVTVSSGNYVLCHVLQTNGNTAGEKVFAVVGQEIYGNINAAREGAVTELNNLITTGLPGPEFIFLGTVIFQTRDSYSNSVKATVRSTDLGDDYVDWRQTELSPASPGSNHSALSGLANDDHIQYALLAGRSGGQILYGGTDTDDKLELYATSDADGGRIFIGGESGSDQSFCEVFNNSDDSDKRFALRAQKETSIEDLSAGGFYMTLDYGEGSSNNTNANYYGMIAFANTFADYTGNMTGSLRGVQSNAQHKGSGTVTNVYSNITSVSNEGTGTISTAYGNFIGANTNTGGGTITNNYGLFVKNQTVGTNNYTLVTEGGDVIINEDGTSADFRVEGDTNPNLLFVDGSEDAVGVSTSTPYSLLDVGGLASSSNNYKGVLGLKTDSNGYALRIQENSGGEDWSIGVDAAGNLNFYDSTGETSNIQIQDVTGNLIVNAGATINEGGSDSNFRVEGNTNANCLLVDGGNDNVTINGTSVSTNYDLGLVGDGVLMLKETTTPTADTNYGKVYTKNDNKLYFQDGSGVEHEIAFV